MNKIVTGLVVLISIYGHTQNKQPMSSVNCVEMVTFRPQQDVSTDELMKAMRATNEIVKTFSGFISRTTSINEDGEFLDLVYWESREKALSAAQKVQELPEVRKNFALIDPSSIHMQHFRVFAVQE